MSEILGSRIDNTLIYWTSLEDIQVVCGCFRGNLVDFELKVKQTHKETAIATDYLKFIAKVKKYMED